MSLQQLRMLRARLDGAGPIKRGLAESERVRHRRWLNRQEIQRHDELLVEAVQRLHAEHGPGPFVRGVVDRTYVALCLERGVTARGNTCTWQAIRRLAAEGRLEARRTVEGAYGNTTLIRVAGGT